MTFADCLNCGCRGRSVLIVPEKLSFPEVVEGDDVVEGCPFDEAVLEVLMVPLPKGVDQ